MAWGFWDRLLGGCTTLLLLTSAAPLAAQTVSQKPAAPQATAPAGPSKPAATTSANPARQAAVKTVAKPPAPVRPARVLAAKNANAPPKNFAIAPKKSAPLTKTIAVAKPAAPVRTAAIAPAAPPSYTITTTHGNVTYTTTRVVPLSALVESGSAAATAAVAPSTHAAATPEAKAAATPAPAAHVAAAPPEVKAPVVPAPSVHAATALPEVKAAVVPASLVQPARVSAVRPATSPLVTDKPATPLAPIAKQAVKPDAATAFVAGFLKEAFRIAAANGTTSFQRRAALAELFAGKMDVTRIAGYTTADGLTGLSPETQQRFRAILVSYLVETYYPRLELASDPTIKVETAAAEPLPDGTAVVWTTFTKDGWGSQSVQWHLVAGRDGFKIVDIFSAGASLVQMERDTFLSVMRNGGLNQLMAKLDARTKELASAATE